MSAEHLGVRLLAEVHEDSLDELLAEIRHSILPNSISLLGVPPLDQLLRVFRSPPSEPPRRPPGGISPALSNDDGDNDDDNQIATRVSRRKPKPAIVELTSTKSSSGKTCLLYHLAAVSTLPNQYDGKESAIVWLDTDGRFSAARLHQLSRQHLSKNHPKLPPSDLDAITKSSLYHVHVFQPQSSGQLLSTLHNLPAYLLEHRNHSSSNRTLCLLVLDSTAAFYCQDRAAAELARLEVGPEASTLQPATSTTADVINALKFVQRMFDCAVLLTSTPTNISKKSTTAVGEGPAPDASISPWNAFATLTLRIARRPVPQFAPGLSVAECLRDQGLRYSAVGEGRFGVAVDRSASGSGRQNSVGEAVERLEGRGGFGVSVPGSGVIIE